MDRTETYPEVGGEESGLVPPQGHKGEWPKKIRTLTAVELDRLTIDGDGRFYWDGRLVNYEAQRQEARPADLDALAILDRAAVELSGQPQGAGDPHAYGDAPAVEQARVVLHLLPRGVGTAEMDDVDRVVRVAVARVDRVDLRAAGVDPVGDPPRRTRRRVAHAEIKEQKLRRREQILTRALRVGRHAQPDEHVFQQLVIALHRWLREARLL